MARAACGISLGVPDVQRPVAFLKNVLVSGTITAIGTAIATAAVSEAENGDAAAAFNAASHVAWGDEAFGADGVSERYTLTGLAIHAGAMLGWAVLQEALFGRWARTGSPARAVASGAATSAAAYAIDYHVLPERLQPGIERRLSPAAMAVSYVALAAMLAIGVRASRPR